MQPQLLCLAASWCASRCQLRPMHTQWGIHGGQPALARSCDCMQTLDAGDLSLAISCCCPSSACTQPAGPACRHNRMMAMCQAVWAALHALTSAYPSCPAVAVPRVGSRLPRPTGAVRVGCVSRTGGGAHWQHLRPPASCPRRGDVHATAAGCTGCSRHPKPAPHCHSIGRATLPTVLLVWCALHACCACLGSLWYSLQATVPCCT